MAGGYKNIPLDPSVSWLLWKQTLLAPQGLAAPGLVYRLCASRVRSSAAGVCRNRPPPAPWAGALALSPSAPRPWHCLSVQVSVRFLSCRTVQAPVPTTPIGLLC